MKIARATADDMQRMFDFFGELEELLRDLRYGGSVDNEVVGALVKKHWGNRGPGVGASWNRVLYGMDTLLRTCTDPKAGTLEWRPDVRKWLESQAGALGLDELESRREGKPNGEQIRMADESGRDR